MIPIGNCHLTNIGENRMFIQIPRNLSTSMLWILKANSFHVKNIKDIPNHRNYKKFTIIRDPIDRFLSGFMHIRERPETNLPFEFFRVEAEDQIKILLDLGVRGIDQHIEPQTTFLKPFGKIDYYLDQQMAKQIIPLMKLRGNLPRRNVSDRVVRLGLLGIILKYEDEISKLYEEDYSLWN